jgi:tyrosyl-tRNA synthetase
MGDFLAILRERGFLEQISDEAGISAYLADPSFAYIGFDPTASSLHVGSLVPIMALAHLARAGHKPLSIVGGGTALIGDPSGKTELRAMLTLPQIGENAAGIRAQLARYIEFGDGKAMMLNNADWLCPLGYLDFLREIGRCFSVNRMIAAEAYKKRLETGLSFIEFNYQILQAYDFLVLCREHGCRLQMGGNDQWGNIVAGIDLIRRELGTESYGLTFPLITTASGAKMGKTAAGAVWLDPGRTTPYQYYQFWRNTEDADVGRFLALFTFLPMAEVAKLAALSGEELNEAKRVLAFEATKITHGEEAAQAAADWKANMPELPCPAADLEAGIPFADLFLAAGVCKSKSDFRRLVGQKGAYFEETLITTHDARLTGTQLSGGAATCRAGKKQYFRVVLK